MSPYSLPTLIPFCWGMCSKFVIVIFPTAHECNLTISFFFFSSFFLFSLEVCVLEIGSAGMWPTKSEGREQAHLICHAFSLWFSSSSHWILFSSISPADRFILCTALECAGGTQLIVKNLTSLSLFSLPVPNFLFFFLFFYFFFTTAKTTMDRLSIVSRSHRIGSPIQSDRRLAKRKTLLPNMPPTCEQIPLSSFIIIDFKSHLLALNVSLLLAVEVTFCHRASCRHLVISFSVSLVQVYIVI